LRLIVTLCSPCVSLEPRTKKQEPIFIVNRCQGRVDGPLRKGPDTQPAAAGLVEASPPIHRPGVGYAHVRINKLMNVYARIVSHRMVTWSPGYLVIWSSYRVPRMRPNGRHEPQTIHWPRCSLLPKTYISMLIHRGYAASYRAGGSSFIVHRWTFVFRLSSTYRPSSTVHRPNHQPQATSHCSQFVILL
jgi:hypothetical protein